MASAEIPAQSLRRGLIIPFDLQVRKTTKDEIGRITQLLLWGEPQGKQTLTELFQGHAHFQSSLGGRITLPKGFIADVTHATLRSEQKEEEDCFDALGAVLEQRGVSVVSSQLNQDRRSRYHPKSAEEDENTITNDIFELAETRLTSALSRKRRGYHIMSHMGTAMLKNASVSGRLS
jgi:hypothetical protein